MSASKKQKLVLTGKAAPLVLAPDTLWDDEPAKTASGRMSKSAKKGGAPQADNAAVETMMREATEAKERRESVSFTRMALAPRIAAEFESMPLKGGETKCLAKIDLAHVAARDYLKAGPPPKWLFMVDKSDSMNGVRPGEATAAGLYVAREAFHRIPAIVELTAGGLDTQIAFGWFGSKAGLYVEGYVEGYKPWMTLRELKAGGVAPKLATRYRADSGSTNISEAIDTVIEAASAARAADDLSDASVIHVVWITDGDATEGETDPDVLALQLEDGIRGCATINSAIAVGCCVKYATIDALCAGSGGYYGYAPDTESFETQLTAAALQFTASKKPFLLELTDATQLGHPFRCCLGMLHSGNCEKLLTLQVAQKGDEGRWCGAQVGYVDDLSEEKSVSTQLMFKFCETADWPQLRKLNPAVTQAVADEEFEARYKKEVQQAMAEHGAKAALDCFDKMVEDTAGLSAAVQQRAELFRERLKLRAEIESAAGFDPSLSGEGFEHAMLFTASSASYSQSTPVPFAPNAAALSSEI